MPTRIAVIESKWFKNRNISVRGLFDLVSDLNTGSPHSYHYEMAMSGAALREAVPRIGSDKDCSYLYIASHGSKNGICLYNEDIISLHEFRGLLEIVKATRGSKLDGLHLGACSVGSKEKAEFLYEGDVGLRWIAGYDKEVDWIASSALDMLFFNYIVDKGAGSSLAGIKLVSEEIKLYAYGLVEELGFGIFVKGRGGKVINLLADIDDDIEEDVED